MKLALDGRLSGAYKLDSPSKARDYQNSEFIIIKTQILSL